MSYAWHASVSTLGAGPWHQLNCMVPQAKGSGQLCTLVVCLGGGQGDDPSPEWCPESMGEIRNNHGEREKRGPGRAVLGFFRDGDPMWEPSPTGEARLLFPRPRRPHV